MPIDAETELLIQTIDKVVGPHGFRKRQPSPTVPDVELQAAWTWKTWLVNRGIALVPIGHYTDHPGDFARKLRRRFGKALGYFPFFYPLGLHVIVWRRRAPS